MVPVKYVFVVTCLFLRVFAVKTQYQPLIWRLVGGSPTSIDQYPILAQLLQDTFGNQAYTQHCAGVILTSRHIISTAHCFLTASSGKNFTNPKYWRIRVGSSFRSRGGTLHKVKTIVPHSGFNKYYYTNDIAVVVASKPFVLGGNVRQGTIPKPGSEIKANSMCSLVGWGSVESFGSHPEQLQQATILSVDQMLCKRRYSNINAVIADSMMCAGQVDIGGVDACYGDSGGPLLYKGLVVGLVSFGYACGHPYYPGVYTKISHYTSWIVKTITLNK